MSGGPAAGRRARGSRPGATATGGELVLDVGMHDGEDTAHYLACGYDVVAVDANPQKCDAARRRFAAEISEGRLEVVNVGLAETTGELDFWVSSQSDWSSFARSNAAKGGATATPIRVPTLSFGELLKRYRTPAYVKIDVEGNDGLCLRDMCAGSRLPSYASFEARPAGIANIDMLAAAGFQRFKCVRQNDWRQITRRNVRFQGGVRQAIARFPAGSLAYRVCYRLHYRTQRVAGDRLQIGGSGALPWDLPHRWWTAEEMRALWRRVQEVDERLGPGGLVEWFDIHAALAAP